MKQLSVVLNNIRSTYNVGAILRTAEGLGIQEIVYAGYTPRYDDIRQLPHLRKKLNHQIEKASLGAEKLVRQIAVDNLPEWLAEQKTQGILITGLENNLEAGELPRRRILGSEVEGDKLVLVLGEEVAGIPPSIRELIDIFLEIPMRGKKESFNVSVAAGIAMWELTK